MTKETPTSGLPFFLCGAEDAEVVSKGLYAGFKSRRGLPAPLPITINPEDEYISAGLIDGLSPWLIKKLKILEVSLRIRHHGHLSVSLYVLKEGGRLYHYTTHQLFDPAHGKPNKYPYRKDSHVAEVEHKDHASYSDSSISVPSALYSDECSRLIFFRISTLGETAELVDWVFVGSSRYVQSSLHGTTLISRSLGESQDMVLRHYRHVKRYTTRKEQYPDLEFFPLPRLIIYESTAKVYKQTKGLLSDELAEYVQVVKNPYNLGGGGNMCLSIFSELQKERETTNFIMADSDTRIPFKTLYLTGALAVCSQEEEVLTTTILYSKSPSKVLESGSVFGRGNWGLLRNYPVQPCILPVYGETIVNTKEAQAQISRTEPTDYPPFIFSLFTSGTKKRLLEISLPTPFFLRGDDIEMGLYLQESQVPCDVIGSLVVFQDPKHSLWHELMAILHGVVIIMSRSTDKTRPICLEELGLYFSARLSAHASIHDLAGLSVYEEVLRRLLSLLEWTEAEMITRFHDPEYYLSMRSLNNGFSGITFQLIEKQVANSFLPPHRFMKLPFLYFAELNQQQPLPERVGLMNYPAKTACIIDVLQVPGSSVRQASSTIQDLFYHFKRDSDRIAHCCKILCSRKSILNTYLPHYPIDAQGAP